MRPPAGGEAARVAQDSTELEHGEGAGLMLSSVLSANGKRWIYGDVFGVSRVNIGKALKLKTTFKATAPRGGVTIDGSGKLALVPGRSQTGVYGDDRVSLLNLPGLGLRHKLTSLSEPACLLGSGDGLRVVELGYGDLEISRVDGDSTSRLRSLSLAPDGGARSLGRRAIGPKASGPRQPDATTPSRLLRVAPDGRFAALSGGRLWGGRIAEEGDVIAWTLELEVHPTVALDVQLTTAATWLTVMDHAGGRAHLQRVGPDGAMGEVITLESIAAPRVTDTWLLYQPSSDAVVRRARASGEETRFEVAAYNAHPRAEPELEVFRGRPRPPAPTRLPGYVDAVGERVMFVPWHREQIIELTKGVVLDRGLYEAAGAYRRAIVEIMTRDNESLARVQLQARLHHLDTDVKGSTSSFGVQLPECAGAIGPRAACEFVSKLTDRFELRTHGWSWGSAGRHGGVSGELVEATLAETRATLEWMRVADAIPLELDSDVRGLYTDMLGIPSDPRPADRPFTPEAERLWLRAMLETIRAQGWPDEVSWETWAKEPITPALAISALAGLRDWSRYRPYEGLHALSCALAHHLEADAQPVLLALIADNTQLFNWKQFRDAGELLVWLCNRNPELKTPSIEAIEAIEHPEVSEWEHEKKTVLDALRRGARHLWSSG